MFGSPEGRIGQVIGGYRLEGALGAGATGIVFMDGLPPNLLTDL